ncbi:MAG TPA: hypothetical protein VGN51_04845 [Acidimicrobiia bacterium]
MHSSTDRVAVLTPRSFPLVGPVFPQLLSIRRERLRHLARDERRDDVVGSERRALDRFRRHDGILVVSEGVLERGKAFRGTLCGLAEDRRDSFQRVAHLLGALANLVQIRIRRSRRQPPDLVAEPLPGLAHQACGRPVEPGRSTVQICSEARCARSFDQSIEEGCIARRVHGLEQDLLVVCTLVLDLADQGDRPRVLAGTQPVRVLGDELGEDIAIPDAAEQATDPAQLVAQRFTPRPIEHGTQRTEIGSQPASGNSCLVDAFRVLAATDDRIVCHQPGDAVRQTEPGEIIDAGMPIQRFGRRDIRRRFRGFAEHAADLRAIAIGLCTRGPEALHHPRNRFGVGFLGDLELDLVETDGTGSIRRPFHHIVVDLTHRPIMTISNLDPTPMGSHLGNRAHRFEAGERTNQPECFLGRLVRVGACERQFLTDDHRARRLGELDRPTVVGPVAETGASPGQSQVRGVEVDRYLVDLVDRSTPHAPEQLGRPRQLSPRVHDELRFALTHARDLPEVLARESSPVTSSRGGRCRRRPTRG